MGFSCSWKIDIPIILVPNEVLNLAVFIDSGSGKNQKILASLSCDFSALEATLLRLHS